MSFWDNVKKFTQPYADDDYDEYDDDGDTGDYAEDTEEPTSRFSRRNSGDDAGGDSDGFDFDVDTPFGASTSAPAPSASAAPAAGGFSGKVVNTSGDRPQVVVFRATQFGDSTRAINELRSKKAVIVNMENVDKAIARRVVDVLCGCVYALDGKVTKVAQSTYLFSPHNMDVSSEMLENLQSEVESYN